MSNKAADRRADLSTIHILQKELGLGKEDAESLKRAVTGFASSADMSFELRSKYIGHLRRMKAARMGQAGARPVYTGHRPELQRSIDDNQDDRWSKARALWARLAKADEVKHDSDQALTAYVKRQTRMEHWRFLNGHQINTVIESLKRWCVRAGVGVD